MTNTVLLVLLVILSTIQLWIVAMRSAEIVDFLRISRSEVTSNKSASKFEPEWIVHWTDGGASSVRAEHIGFALIDAQRLHPNRHAKSIRMYQ
jgi:hypothetical protein